jgi:branched-chain amino acid transport system substrate-binding protein
MSTLVVALAAPMGFAAPIRIGASLSLEGKYKENSEMIRDAYQLWARRVNRQGGLLGRQVELIFYDDHSREDLVRENYRKLIETDHVDLLLSPYGSPLTLAASEISEAHKYVMVACSASAKALWERGYHYLFGIYATADRYFVGLLDLMAQQGYHTVAILHENNVFNLDIASGIVDWARRFRMTVAWNRGFNDAQADLPQAIQDLKKLRPTPDGLIVSAYVPACYRVLDLLKTQGYRPPVLAMTIAPVYPEFYKRTGPMGENVFAASQWEPDQRIPFPGTKEFIQEFNSLYGLMPSYHAGSAYATCEVMARAVSKAGSLDQTRLRDIIASLDTVTVIGRFKVDSRGMQIGHNPILIQWQDGRKEIVYPIKMQTAKPRF